MSPEQIKNTIRTQALSLVTSVVERLAAEIESLNISNDVDAVYKQLLAVAPGYVISPTGAQIKLPPHLYETEKHTYIYLLGENNIIPESVYFALLRKINPLIVQHFVVP